MTANTEATAENRSKLSDTGLIMLAAAAQRDDRLLLPVPASISVPPEVIRKTIKSLMAKSMVEERPAKMKDVVWRKDEKDQNFTLSITDVGIAALDGDHTGVDEADDAKTLAHSQSKGSAGPLEKAATSKRPKPTSKISKDRGKGKAVRERRTRKETKAGQILTLLTHANGTTVAEMMKATGWQVHSIRGFLSGTVKKRMGLKLASEQAKGKDRRYKIPAKA